MEQRRRPMQWLMFAGLGAVLGFLAAIVAPTLGDGGTEPAPASSRSPEPEPDRPTAVVATPLRRPATMLSGDTSALSLVAAAHTIVFAADGRPDAARAGVLALALNAPLVLVPTPADPDSGPSEPGAASERRTEQARAADDLASPQPDAASDDPSPGASARDVRAQAAQDARRRGVVRAIAVGDGASGVARDSGAPELVEVASAQLPEATSRQVIAAAAGNEATPDDAASDDAAPDDAASDDATPDGADPDDAAPDDASERPAAASGSPSPPTIDGLDIVDSPLPRAPTTGAALLVRPSAGEALAAVVTARAAGHEVVPTRASDLRADPAVGARLADIADGDDPPLLVLAGDAFADTDPDAVVAHAAVAMTGVELPGGGQLVFDPDDASSRRYVGLYGVPQSPALGVLGEQPVHESVERAQRMSDDYRAVVDGDVEIIPAFEIIATIASSSAGDDGDYSNELPIAELRPAVDAAGDAGLYVLLDLQPGRTDFLTQAERYRELLQEPHVGLALDPEWRLRPDERHLAQIGSVGVDEVNEVSGWLADLVASERLPQKMLLLHQFRTSMIRERERLDTTRDELAFVVQMDGQGPQGTKLETWAAIKADAPPRLRFGWKNFYDEDTPTRSPADTMALDPPPVFVSYQ